MAQNPEDSGIISSKLRKIISSLKFYVCQTKRLGAKLGGSLVRATKSKINKSLNGVFWGRLAGSVSRAYMTLDLGVVSSSPALRVELTYFKIYRYIYSRAKKNIRRKLWDIRNNGQHKLAKYMDKLLCFLGYLIKNYFKTIP